MRLLHRLLHLAGKSSLVLRFAVVSAVLVATIGVVAANWLSSYIRSSNINNARDTAAYSVSLTVRQLGFKPGDPIGITNAQYALTTSLLGSMVATGKYVGAIAWQPKGLIVYAREPGRIGTVEKSRPQLQEAFQGQVVTTVVRTPMTGVKDATERAALKKSGPLLESFAPVVLDGKVLAVVQLYQVYRPVEKAIARQTQVVFWSILAGTAVLWVGLFSLVLSASRKVREQSAANLYLASHDSLTGLANRSKLRAQVDDALHDLTWSGRRMGLMLLDLDRFKEVNDTLGHHYGDALLTQVGPRLSVALREGDSIARLGGDEFVVVLAEIEGEADAVAVAERIKRAFAEPFHVDSVNLDVQASIGIAISPERGGDFDTLLQHADIAMYTAKTSRSYFSVYNSAGDERNAGQLERIGQLRRAVGDPQQLVLHYQPKADLVTGEVRGVEALVRWQHPSDGLLSPAEFIPLAERTGLIGPLTILVLREALGRLHAWNEAGLKLSMAVNISTRNLLDPAFSEIVGGLVREYAVDPATVELEISESAVLVEPERSIAVLTKLAEIGVRLSVDDFGTGHSSMSYLKMLPVHQLKIDRSFVHDMTTNATDAVIVRTCIDLARNLGLEVVAEGVEDAAAWRQLTELGCQLAQGFYLAKPMPAPVLLAWLTERQLRGTAHRQLT